MATYKVPQDVEADDKLIGPFSFRQFIYLIIVAMAGALAWGLAQLFIGLAIIPLPVILFFGTLALPLRKDQPMEIYMAAMVSFYLKPRKRLWDPEGIETMIEIIAPKTVEVQRAKDLSQGEAEQRLSYLANIVDSQGWAIRGVSGAAGTAMNNDIFLEAQSATDVLDTNTSIAQSFDQMMNQTAERAREEARERMFQPAATPAPVAATPQMPTYPQPAVNQTAAPQAQQYAYTQPAATTPAPDYMATATQPAVPQPAAPIYNPYPTFHQSVVQPLNDPSHQAQSDITTAQPASPGATTQTSTPTQTPNSTQTAPTTSDIELTTGIMNLANNPDLSIETIAHEANRLHKKAEDESEEVVISLR